MAATYGEHFFLDLFLQGLGGRDPILLVLLGLATGYEVPLPTPVQWLNRVILRKERIEGVD